MPLWFCPRHWGQSSARAVRWKTARQTEAAADAGARAEKNNRFCRTIDREIVWDDKRYLRSLSFSEAPNSCLSQTSSAGPKQSTTPVGMASTPQIDKSPFNRDMTLSIKSSGKNCRRWIECKESFQNNLAAVGLGDFATSTSYSRSQDCKTAFVDNPHKEQGF